MQKVLAIVGVVVVVVILVAIGISRKGKSDSSRTIGVVPKGTSSPFWETVRQGALKAGGELGYEIIWQGPKVESDRAEQIRIVKDLITQRVAGVVLGPNDSRAQIPVVEELAERKIPCVIIDSGIETDQIISFVATDNYQGGVIAAKRMGEILDGKGNILVVKFLPGSASTTKRENGFMETIENEFPGITIVDHKYGMETVNKAVEAAEDMLTRNADVDGIFGSNNHATIGAVRALEGRDLAGKVKVVGFDSEDALIQMLESGAIDSLVVQDPFRMGYEGVKTVVAAIEGKSDIQRRVDTGVELVTKDRLEEPEIRILLGLK